MASTREQPRSEISFRDELIRVSCLKGRTEKLNELSPFTDGMPYAPPVRQSSQIVSALIHGINGHIWALLHMALSEMKRHVRNIERIPRGNCKVAQSAINSNASARAKDLQLAPTRLRARSAQATLKGPGAEIA
jgi:hypothetical protein